MKNMEQLEDKREWTTDPNLGIPAGKNENGAALRMHDGRIYILLREPEAARSSRQEIKEIACDVPKRLQVEREKKTVGEVAKSKSNAPT